jgi:hypothetical protein
VNLSYLVIWGKEAWPITAAALTKMDKPSFCLQGELSLNEKP